MRERWGLAKAKMNEGGLEVGGKGGSRETDGSCQSRLRTSTTRPSRRWQRSAHDNVAMFTSISVSVLVLVVAMAMVVVIPVPRLDQICLCLMTDWGLERCRLEAEPRFCNLCDPVLNLRTPPPRGSVELGMCLGKLSLPTVLIRRTFYYSLI